MKKKKSNRLLLVFVINCVLLFSSALGVLLVVTTTHAAFFADAPTATATATEDVSPTVPPTPTNPPPTPTSTRPPKPTATPVPPKQTPTPRPMPSPTATPTSAAEVPPGSTPTSIPSATPSPSPSATPTATPGTTPTADTASTPVATATTIATGPTTNSNTTGGSSDGGTSPVVPIALAGAFLAMAVGTVGFVVWRRNAVQGGEVLAVNRSLMPAKAQLASAGGRWSADRVEPPAPYRNFTQAPAEPPAMPINGAEKGNIIPYPMQGFAEYSPLLSSLSPQPEPPARHQPSDMRPLPIDLKQIMSPSANEQQNNGVAPLPPAPQVPVPPPAASLLQAFSGPAANETLPINGATPQAQQNGQQLNGQVPPVVPTTPPRGPLEHHTPSQVAAVTAAATASEQKRNTGRVPTPEKAPPPSDSYVEAMMRQAQSGLYALPGKSAS